MSQCYICLEEINPDLESGEIVQSDGERQIISPCDCNHYAHVDCLFEWIKTKKNAHRCEICKVVYKNIGFKEDTNDNNCGNRTVAITVFLYMALVIATIPIEHEFMEEKSNGLLGLIFYMFGPFFVLAFASCIDRKNYFMICIDNLKNKGNKRVMPYVLTDGESNESNESDENNENNEFDESNEIVIQGL